MAVASNFGNAVVANDAAVERVVDSISSLSVEDSTISASWILFSTLRTLFNTFGRRCFGASCEREPNLEIIKLSLDD